MGKSTNFSEFYVLLSMCLIAASDGCLMLGCTEPSGGQLGADNQGNHSIASHLFCQIYLLSLFSPRSIGQRHLHVQAIVLLSPTLAAPPDMRLL